MRLPDLTVQTKDRCWFHSEVEVVTTISGLKGPMEHGGRWKIFGLTLTVTRIDSFVWAVTILKGPGLPIGGMVMPPRGMSVTLHGNSAVPAMKGISMVLTQTV
jgi:hypothetical protein